MMKSYLINLDKDKERLAFFSENFHRLGLEFERIAAVDGRLFSEEDYQAFMRERPRNFNHKQGKQWLRGQMGCFLSHYTAWQKIAKSDHDFCAVFEDDIHISEDLKDLLADDQWIPADVDVIRLETSTNRVLLTPDPLLTKGKHKAYGIKSTTWCAGAYIMNRSTARRLIELPTKYHEPADIIFYNFSDSIIARDLKLLQFNPALCTQDKHLLRGNIQFASNIETEPQHKNPLSDKLKKLSPLNLANAVYKSMMGYQRIGF